MGKFLNALAKAAKESISDSLADLNKSWNEFDFDTEMTNMKRRMDIASKRLGREIKKMNKHVHNYFDKWEVDVNFNQDEDIITSQIKNGSISIKVVKETNGNTTEFMTTIPEDVIIESMVQKYNPETKKAIFSFTKKDE